MNPKISAKKGSRASAGSKKTSAPARGAGDDPRIARLERLVRILESSSLAELEYEDEEIAVGLKRHGAGAPGSPPPMPLPLPMPSMPALIPPPSPPPVVNANPPAAASAKQAPVEDKSIVVVRSPFVGTFYSAPSPEASDFTEVGKRVRRGQTLCIIEAMKLMNEIESEVDGVVLEISAENGKPVQYGDALFRIQT